MLRGSELLSKVKELDSLPKSEVVRACGYVTPRKDGPPRLNYTAFYEALLDAKGMSFGGAGESASRTDSGGRKLSYMVKVHFNGNLLVGKAYTSMLGLKPGDEFDIRLEKKGIRLIPKHHSDDMASSEAVPAGASEEPSAAAPLSPAPSPAPATPASVAPQGVPRVTSPSTPMAPPVAPAPIPAPVAAPVAPPAPGIPSIPQPAPVAFTPPPAPAGPPSTAPQQSAPKTTPQTPPPVDSWEDSLRKLDQSSRPVPWDA